MFSKDILCTLLFFFGGWGGAMEALIILMDNVFKAICYVTPAEIYDLERSLITR